MIVIVTAADQAYSICRNDRDPPDTASIHRLVGCQRVLSLPRLLQLR